MQTLCNPVLKKNLSPPALPIPSREKFAKRSIVLVASIPSVSSSSRSGDSKNDSPTPRVREWLFGNVMMLSAHTKQTEQIDSVHTHGPVEHRVVWPRNASPLLLGHVGFDTVRTVGPCPRVVATAMREMTGFVVVVCACVGVKEFSVLSAHKVS